MKIPEPTNSTISEIYKIYTKRREKPRQYLGWSQIGRSCERELWFAFRFAFNNTFDGRMLRLFDTGFREEARIISELRDIGCTVECVDRATGKQIGVESFGGHFRGHVDAIVTGFVEAPKTPHLMDVKTCSVKNFEKVVKDGMQKTYPVYWAQAHGYMGKLGLKRGAYIFVCKDDERIHIERFEYDAAVFEKYEKRAESIIFSDRIPPPLSTDPSWYECKWCSAHDLCHGSKLTQNVNCRTCAHSTAERDGTWSCAQYEATIPDLDAQLAGCSAHILHPDLTPWQYKPSEHGVIWLTPHGEIENGISAAGVFESLEIVANPQACAQPDKFVAETRAIFGAKVVG
jgi:hypothetical protein